MHQRRAADGHRHLQHPPHHERAGPGRSVRGAVRAAEPVRRTGHDHPGNAELHPVHRERSQQADRCACGRRTSPATCSSCRRARSTSPAGYEHRDLSRLLHARPGRDRGRFERRAFRSDGGGYDVDEFYVELNAPILADARSPSTSIFRSRRAIPIIRTSAARPTTSSVFRWQMVDDLTLRGTWAEGFRAPSIGELFGTFSRFDATLVDPCGGNVTRELPAARRAAGLHAEQSADLDHHRRQPEPAAGNVEEPDARRDLQPDAGPRTRAGRSGSTSN